MLAVPALAQAQYEKEVPFTMKGEMTAFYGGPKSAEADMWEKALNVCKNLSVGENNGLLLNRISPVEFSTGSSSSISTATFVCLPAGSAD